MKINDIVDDVMVKPTQTNASCMHQENRATNSHGLSFSDALCDELNYLSTVKQWINAATEDNSQTLAHLKQSIASGCYTLNSACILEKMLAKC